MNKDEASKFVTDRIMSRFSAWEPSQADVEDWILWLIPHTWGVAESAMLEMRKRANLKTPSSKIFNEVAGQKTQELRGSKRKESPKIMTWIQNQRTGAFHAVVTKEWMEDNTMDMHGSAMELAQNYHNLYGDEFLAYEGRTADEMIDMRNSFRLE